jgi:hypothetical protein
MPHVGPLDVRIKINQTGVCGTDVHLHHGTYMGVYPLTPGHETIGEVEQVGSEVTRFHPGQQVTVNPNIYCGHCAYCLAGQLGRCANTEGMGVHRPGFFAEYVSADHRQVFAVDGLEPDIYRTRGVRHARIGDPESASWRERIGDGCRADGTTAGSTDREWWSDISDGCRHCAVQVGACYWALRGFHGLNDP